jgi:hypothetical protein
VPSTAINSMIAALTALLFGYSSIVLSNERSASEGNVEFDGREANHQYSKSLDFERLIAGVLSGRNRRGARLFLAAPPLFRGEDRPALRRRTQFDHVFSSCNRNFKLAGPQGPAVVRRMPEVPLRLPDLRPRDGEGPAGRHLRQEPARPPRATSARSAS